PASAIDSAVRAVLPRRLRDLAAGTPLGHPIHPALVAIPAGAWTAASYLDLVGGEAKAAQRLIGLGNVAAVPAAIAGVTDWLDTAGAERRVGLVHAALN